KPPFSPAGIGLYFGLAGAFVLTYLWPLLILVLAWAVVRAVFASSLAVFPCALLSGALMAVVLALVLLGTAYARLRSAEGSDAVDQRAPDPSNNAGMFARENRCRQNHMISITERKPGFLRSFTQRLVFWGIGRV